MLALLAALSAALAERLELGGGHNSPAASTDHFVEEWRKFARH